MKLVVYILLVGCLTTNLLFGKGEPKKDTTFIKPVTNTNSIAITKLQLINLIDSLLDLPEIDEKQIELINYYSSIINSKDANLAIVKYGNIPASTFYEDFDESIIFQISNELDFPESQLITIENDSLGTYHQPKIGQINSKFGWRDGRMHKGIDINLNRGDAVVSAFDGMVRIAQAKGAFGNVVIIRHYNGLETVYAHLSKILVEAGQTVEAGQIIGLGGNTGHSFGAHLHFEMRYLGQAIDAEDFVDFQKGILKNNTVLITKADVETKYDLRALHSRQKRDLNTTRVTATSSKYGKIYKVKKGDTLGRIAQRNHTTIKSICKKNGIKQTKALQLGQKLKI